MRPIRTPRRLLLGAAACLTVLTLAPSPAMADTPLDPPTRLQAQHVADVSADLTWVSSGLVDQDVVQRRVNGVWQEYARVRYSAALALTGLTPGTTYTFRVYSIPLSGMGFTTSAPTQPVSFTTLSGPDTVPPSPPPAPLFSSVTTNRANVFWGEATDNVQVTGYALQQLTGAGWTTVRTVGAGERFQGFGGLTPATSYTFAVIAYDARGNASQRSAPATVTTLATTPYPMCQAQVIQYNPGFQVTVTITNTTTAIVSGWTVGFTLATTAAAGPSFGGTLTRNGTAGTITPVVWSNQIGPGGQLFVGFGGSAVPFTPPTGFTLNGLPCSTS
jgi:hypothetical protein